MTNEFSIREETSDDVDAIRNVVELAFRESEFGHNGEAELVEKLRVSHSHLSFVASEADDVVGHIMFSRVAMRSAAGEVKGMGLAPLSVLPSHQRKGIGAGLIGYGIDHAFEQAIPSSWSLGIQTTIRDLDSGTAASSRSSTVSPVFRKTVF